MAYNYPYFYPSYRRYPNYAYNYPNFYSKSYEQNKSTNNKALPKSEPISQNIASEERTINTDDSRECFEIFGIKLFFDDILLICLIFFLYNEGVKDQYLFISLILLLLS